MAVGYLHVCVLHASFKPIYMPLHPINSNRFKRLCLIHLRCVYIQDSFKDFVDYYFFHTFIANFSTITIGVGVSTFTIIINNKIS